MEKNMKKSVYVIHNWVTSLYSSNWHNTVIQIYFNKKKEYNQKTNVMLKRITIT